MDLKRHMEKVTHNMTTPHSIGVSGCGSSTPKNVTSVTNKPMDMQVKS